MKKSIILLISLTLIICLTIEIVLRKTKEKVSYSEIFQKCSEKNVPYEFKPNINIDVWDKTRTYTMNVITNSQGLREATDTITNKKKLIGLGDSIMMGSGVNNDETFLKEIERNLDIQTFNFGVGGFNTRTEYYYLEYKRAKDYSPDVILLQFITNDFDMSGRVFRDGVLYRDLKWNKGNSLLSNIKQILLQSRIIYWLATLKYKVISRIQGKTVVYKIHQEQVDEVKYWFSQIKNYAEECNAEFIVAVFPSRREVEYSDAFLTQQIVKQICKELDIECYDLLPELKKYKNIFLDEMHPNIKGQKIIGKLISEKIKEKFNE